MGADELTAQVASKDPEVGLAAVAALRRLLTDVERLQVDRARSLGWSWAEIARVLGVTRQSVHEKHRARRKAMGLED
jgi:DNA-directed RNA polymerase specialized sigma24 family protein